MTNAWFLWYGMACGLSRTETMDMPWGALLDQIALYQINVQGARYKRPSTADEDIIPDVV